MNEFYGADTDQVRDHRELLRDRARSLGALRERLQPAVMDESAWRGADADAFRSRWSAHTSPLFDQVAQLVEQRAADLEAHAEEQDAASSAGGDSGGPGGDGDPGADGPSLWERLTGGLDVYNTLQGLFSKGKKVWELTGLVRDWQRIIGGAEDIFQLTAGTWHYGQQMVGEVFGAGKEYSGLVSKLLGKLGVPTGFGPKSFFGWVDNLATTAGDAMPFLRTAAPWVGRALPALDVVFGGKQLIDGIRSGDTFSAVTGGANALGGGLMLAGGVLSATGVGAVVGGPLAAAGAIISGGAAIADLGKMVYDNWDSISSTASQAWETTTGAIGDGLDAVGDGLDTVGGAISDGWDGLTGAFGF